MEDELSVGGEALSMHPLVQTVLKDAMPARTQRRWAERTVKAVRRAFAVGVYIRQAQACAVLIEEWGLISKEAADLLYRAGCHAQQRQLNRMATSLFQQALLICERIGKTNGMLMVCCLFRLGQVSQARQQFEEAESSYQRALDVRTHLRGSAPPTAAQCKLALGQLYAQQGKDAQAEAIYRELVEQGPPSIAVLEACAALYVEQGRYAEAEALIQQELAMLRSALEPSQLEYLKVTAVIPYLMELYLEQGKTVEAEALIQQELATLRSVLAPTDYQVITMSEHLIDIYRYQGREDEAEALLQHLIHVLQQSPQKNAKDGIPMARNLLSLAGVLADKGALEEAEECYRRAIAIVDTHERPERALQLTLLMSYASFLVMIERAEEAEQLMARAEALYEEIQGQNAFWAGLWHYLNEGALLGNDAIDSLS